MNSRRGNEGIYVGTKSGMNSKVSIIILNWNGRDHTIECLHSVRQLDYPNSEIILVDNGSSDGSQEVIKSEFPEVKLIENTTNLGFSKGINSGIDLALSEGAEYVFILNNDVIVEPDILGKLVKEIRLSNEIGATVPKVYQYYKRNYLDSCGLTITFGPPFGKPPSGIICQKRGFDEYDYGQYSSIEEIEAFSGCGVLLKKQVLENVGLFDTDYFFYCEDVDLSIRFRNAGYKILFVPDARMWHKVSATAGHAPNVFKGKLLGESIVRFMKKNAGLKEWLIFIARISLALPAVLLKYTLRGDLKVIWAKITGAVLAFCR
jgi:GT2 family glycosyltransferase